MGETGSCLNGDCSAAVVLARVGPSSLAVLLLLEELTDVFGSHYLGGGHKLFMPLIGCSDFGYKQKMESRSC